MKFLATLAVAAAAVQAATDWKNVRIGGGGGFVPGIIFHPSEKGLAYARTDIGGLYKLNSDDSWTPVTDGIADSDNWHNWGIDAVGLDPQNANVVYAALGMYTNSWDPANGAIAKSTNRGASWTFSNLPFKVGGNMPGRGMGERLAVDPKNSNIVYFGARSGKGLWKSTDAGRTFAKVASFTAVGTYVPDPSDTNGLNSDIHGLAFVTFDSTSGTTGGATSRIFVGTADKTTSVYVSEDAGATWKAVAGQPSTFLPHKCILQPKEKALYLTYSDGTGPYDGTLGAVYRYDITAKQWKDITPPVEDLAHGFGGLGVDMQKPGTLVVASLNSWWPDAQLWRSTDSGSTWKPIWKWASYPEMDKSYTMDVGKAPWIKTNFLDVDTKWLGWMIESLEIDPLDSEHWLYGTGLTIFGGHDLTKWDAAGGKVAIQSLADGIEEFSVQEVKSAPGGSELLAAVGDESGFTFKTRAGLGTAPQTAWNNPMFTSSVGVDYAGNKPASVVRVGNTGGSPMVALSYDGGASWNVHPGADTSKYGGKVSLSADADTVLWSSVSGVLRSQNQGPFAGVASLPTGAVIAADRRDNKYFYGATGGTFYVSSDTASSFTRGATLSGVGSIRDIATHPSKAGEVYVSTDQGIFKSTNYGSSFAKISTGLTDTHQMSLGVGSTASWNLYAFGTGSSGKKGLFGSADGGASWTDVQGDTQTFGAVDSAALSGSGNDADYVYVGTNGRGVFYGKVTLKGGSGPDPQPTTTTTTLATSVRPPVTTTTTATSSKPPPVTTTASSTQPPTSTETAKRFEQCGGNGWTGPTRCESPYTCTKGNDWYWQCL